MRWFWACALSAGLLLGCSGRTNRSAGLASARGNGPANAQTNDLRLIVTPGGPLPGKVVLVNPNGRFVVLSFPLGAVPAPDRRLNAYRQGLKVGELKVTGPQRDQNTVADILTGNCQPGDEVKAD